MADEQRIRDPIHNLIKFSLTVEDDKVLWNLLQSFPLQRLRRIKQLGFSDFVYPGASHTRFSHSLGVMQMARRMIEMLTKNELLGKDPDFELWKRATLCAALLHDIGHGPFSHVFEDVSAKLGIKTDHENFTLRIIQESEIAKLLKEHSPHLLENTLSFFKEEPGANIYSNIVSSQLDADRLDFLLRDRYFTGIRFGELDIEWLLDSLRIDNVTNDPEFEIPTPTFVLSEKGLSVAKEYVAAYMHMYLSVYFHKTTRGIEVLIREILCNVLSNGDFLARFDPNNPLIQYVTKKGEISVDTYLALDDSTILAFIKQIANGEFDKGTVLARRFFRRDLFKCFEVPLLSGGALPSDKIREFQETLKKLEIIYFRDKTPPKGYKQFAIHEPDFLKNILVFSKNDGVYRPIGDLRRCGQNS